MQVDDLALVYKDTTPNFYQGGVVKIIDTSSDDPTTFLVVALEDIGEATYKYRHDPEALKFVLLGEYSFWIKKENCKKLSIEKKSFWKRIFG